MNVPRYGVAMISPNGFTRFCLGIGTPASAARQPIPVHFCFLKPYRVGLSPPDITKFNSERYGGQVGRLTTSFIGKSPELLHFSEPRQADLSAAGHPTNGTSLSVKLSASLQRLVMHAKAVTTLCGGISKLSDIWPPHRRRQAAVKCFGCDTASGVLESRSWLPIVFIPRRPDNREMATPNGFMCYVFRVVIPDRIDRDSCAVTTEMRVVKAKRHARNILQPKKDPMLKLRTTVAACLALSAIGGIIACSSQLAKSGNGDAKTNSSTGTRQPPSASPTATAPLPSAKELAKADEAAPAAEPAASGKKPNIVFIMGDDIGMWNIGAYHRGMMAGRTPHLDKLAKEGMLFTDYYAEASCTAGRANFITGELPIRTGLTTVGQAGAKIGLPAEACTIATALKAAGLRHRPVRQEPPGRPQRISAHRPRLRRILRLPVSLGRHGRPGASQLPAGIC